MKQAVHFILCSIAVVFAAGAHAATPSVNGSYIPAEASIIDAQENTWTVVSGVAEKNAVPAANNYDVDMLLDLNQVLYQRNTSSDWYRWNGGSWTSTSDPRVVSASGTRIGVGDAVLIDSGKHVWTLPASEYAYRDGYRADGNYNTVSVLYYEGVVYCENASKEWYSWSGTAWTRASGDPTAGTSASAGASATPSSNGASIGVGSAVIIDAKGNRWTLPSTEYAMVNGNRADGNYDTILVLYYNGTIYCENSSGEWYSWSGSVWTKVAGNPENPAAVRSVGGSADPRGASLVQYTTYTSPVCPGSDPSCTPAFVNNSSVTFTSTTTKGNAIWVAATVSDYGGVHAISVTDSQNNVYHALGQVNDQAPGSQSLAQFYAQNIAGGSDTITVNWTSDNYKGVVAAEIAGVTASPLVGSSVNIQDGGLASASDNISAHGISIVSGDAPSLVVALTMDTDGGGSDVGGTGFCAVSAGTGFTQVAQFWSWSPTGAAACNLATLETMKVSVAGTAAGEFTTPHLSDPYTTVATVFH
jgi:hypothetical protein